MSAITRKDSDSSLPGGLTVKKVDYDDPSSLSNALQGQDALVITMGRMAPGDTQTKLLDAAAAAKVPWVLPNEWSPDTASEGLVKDVFAFQPKPKARDHIRELGVSSYIAVTTGFWYEWSLAIPEAFGFDFANRSITLFDEGETVTNISTWQQVGRAVASLLSLPIKSESDAKACLDDYRNRQIYVSSFSITQKDMLESVLRVTDTKLDDWKISREPVKERYAQGQAQFQKGDRLGFAKMMYSRVFYPDDLGNFEKRNGLVNDALSLPKESIDEATKRAIARSQETTWKG